MSRRTERVSGVLREEVSRLVSGALRDPRLSPLVTVARVEVSADLQHATLAVTVLGDERQRREAMEGLDSAKSYLRRELGQRLRLKRTPELTFVLDASIEEGDHVLTLLDELRENRHDNG